MVRGVWSAESVKIITGMPKMVHTHIRVAATHGRGSVIDCVVMIREKQSNCCLKIVQVQGYCCIDQPTTSNYVLLKCSQ